MSVAARVDGDHFELPADAVELLRQVRPADRQGFIEEVTQALAVAAQTKDFRPLQDVLEAWTVTVRLQQQPGYVAMIDRMQRRERGVPVDLDQCAAHRIHSMASRTGQEALLLSVCAGQRPCGGRDRV